jgi:hypothetical protein
MASGLRDRALLACEGQCVALALVAEGAEVGSHVAQLGEVA